MTDDEKFDLKVQDVAAKLLALNGTDCLLDDGRLDVYAFSMACAHVIGSNASLLPTGPELMHRVILQMGESYRAGFDVGGLPN